MSLRKFFKISDSGDKGIEKKGIRRLLDKEGFYVIMFLCVCIVGITAVWVAKTNIDRLAEDELQYGEEMNVAESDIIDMPEDEIENQSDGIIIIDQEDDEYSEVDTLGTSDEEAEEILENEVLDSNEIMKDEKDKVLVEESASKAKAVTIEASAKEEENQDEAIETSNAKALTMLWPVQGELGMGYAVETLVYSKTLEHFTTHHGIDIMAEMNTPVKAALAGEIIEVLTDSRLGITISIKHEEGLVTRYSNLCVDAMVNVGDKVTKGQTISGVGTSSIFESTEDPHLHFEVLINGENVDPMEYLAEE